MEEKVKEILGRARYSYPDGSPQEDEDELAKEICQLSDQECQERVERIKREIEENSYNLEDWGDDKITAIAIELDKWKAIWKRVGIYTEQTHEEWVNDGMKELEDEAGYREEDEM